MSPSAQRIAVGETYDFEFTLQPGNFQLRIVDPSARLLWARELVVR